MPHRVSLPRTRWCLLVALAGGLVAAGCASAPPLRRPLSIMGPTEVPASAMAAWFRAQTEVESRATVPVEILAAYYAEEAAFERVRGDLAFVQAVHETDWFRFTGVVDAAANNFAGLGATGSRPRPNRFPDARIGVRAQIQHLRAYADPTATTCTAPPLHHACVDPRFRFVTPKGKAPTWQQMGNGNWARDPEYAAEVLTLYQDLRRFAGLAPW